MRSRKRFATATTVCATLLLTACPLEESEDAATSPRDASTSPDQRAATDAGPTADTRANVDAGPAPDGGVDLDQLVGWVRVLDDEVWAAIYDRSPYYYIYERYFEVVAEDGDCQVRSRPTGFCDPPCAGGELCTPEDTCVLLAQLSPAGDLVFDGLLQEVTLQAEDYGYAAVRLPHGERIYETGAAISVTAAGGETSPFSTQTHGVEQLAVTGETEFELQEGEPITLGWEADPRGDRIEVFLTPWLHAIFDIGTHIRCRTTDTGEVTIPWSLLQHMPLNSECLGMMCGSVSHIARYSESYAAVAQGLVRLRVESRRQLWISRFQ